MRVRKSVIIIAVTLTAILAFTLFLIYRYSMIDIEPAPFSVRTRGETKYINSYFENELLNEIRIARSLGKSGKLNREVKYLEGNRGYIKYRIAEIDMFYLPIVKNFELMGIDIWDAGFIYYYAPVKKPDSQFKYFFSTATGVEIYIARPEKLSVTPAEHLKQMSGSGKVDDLTTGDHFVYYGNKHHSDSIYGQFDDTIIRIIAPAEYRGLDAMRDLCKRVIETIEVVYVD